MKGRRAPEADATPPEDPTAWILNSGFADFVLLHTNEIKYMCMLGYTFMHGSKVFKAIGDRAPFTFRFVNMIMACTGGGILVPIFINKVPVPMSQDAYPIIIMISFLLHQFFPILREILLLSPIFKAAVIFLYETLRATVVVKLTAAAAAAIPASDFDFPLFGPIMCGSIAGCGGAFLPLNKGLEPIKNGLAPPMFSAFIGATFYHLFMNTSLSEGVIDAHKKAHVIVSTWFILYGWFKGDIYTTLFTIPSIATPVKKEEEKPAAATKKTDAKPAATTKKTDAKPSTTKPEEKKKK